MSAHYRDLILYKTQADLRAEAAKNLHRFPVVGARSIDVHDDLLRGIRSVAQARHSRFRTISVDRSGLLAVVSKYHFPRGNGDSRRRGLMQQVYLPKVILPLVVILTDLVKFGVVLGLMLSISGRRALV
ncbi:MAG: hypothetical protein R3F40_07620 [Candidatus Competibacteraceae bacterium]